MLSRKRDENENKKRTSIEPNHDGQSARLIYIWREIGDVIFSVSFWLLLGLVAGMVCVRVSHFICIHFSQDMFVW